MSLFFSWLGPNSVNYPGIIVPQQVYTSFSQKGFSTNKSITFQVNNLDGVRLRDALRLPIRGLDRGQVVPHLSYTRARISLRVTVRLDPRLIV